MTYELFRYGKFWFFIIRREPVDWRQRERGEPGAGVAIGWRRKEREAVEAAEGWIRTR